MRVLLVSISLFFEKHFNHENSFVCSCHLEKSDQIFALLIVNVNTDCTEFSV